MISVQTQQSHMTTMMEFDEQKRPSTPETLPGTVSSLSLDENLIVSSLSISTENTTMKHGKENSPKTLTPANAPSSVCQQRKLSAAIVTSPEAAHEYVGDRPTVTVEDLHHKKAESDNMKCETPSPSKDRISNRNQRGAKTCPKQKRNGKQEEPVHLHALTQHSVANLCSGGHQKSLLRQSSAPAYTVFTEVLNDPPPMRVDAWTETNALTYNVRGCNYMSDKKKAPSEESLFSLLTVDLVQSSDKSMLQGLCNHPNERIQRALQRERESGVRELPDFIFAINIAVPGPPFYHLVIYFGCEDIEEIRTDDTPVGRLAKAFFFGSSDEFRDNTMKLIPRIVDGNYIVKKAVGSKPTILGRKLKQHYVRDPRFLEVIVDIGSDPIAKKVVALSMGYAKSIVVDMMFLLEGTTEATLPERILGGVRLKNLDFKKRDGQRVVQKYS